MAGAALVKSFAPVINTQCRMLVLGTIPGPDSLARGEYYADETNKFWPIIYAAFHANPGAYYQASYEEKTEFLIRQGIAIWDVVAECRRRGSSDRELTDVKPNDFQALLEEYGGIAYIGFNGQTAAQLFAKHVGLGLPAMRYILLPSTSGARPMQVELKVELWRTVLECLLTHRNLL